MNNYTIISGFYHKPKQEAWAEWFYELWCRCLPKDRFQTIVIANGGCVPPEGHDDTLIGLEGNCGHVHQLIGKEEPTKPHAYCGWSSVVLSGAMLCYANETDMVYVEQDCLMFGDCVGEMYRELGSGLMIFGRSRTMPCAQSLFLIRHAFIPEFMLHYMDQPNDRNDHFLPEAKFSFLKAQRPSRIKQFRFPFDRDRPLDMTLPIWYAQKLAPSELREAEQRGLLVLPPNMPDVRAFTNDATGL